MTLIEQRIQMLRNKLDSEQMDRRYALVIQWRIAILVRAWREAGGKLQLIEGHQGGRRVSKT